MSIEFNPPEWAPYAIPSSTGWRHPVTKELLVAIPGGVKTKPVVEEAVAVVPQPVIDESPVAIPTISETVVAETVINETVVAEPVIDELPVAEEVIAEEVKVEEKAPAVESKVIESKPVAKRGPKPKAK